MSEGTQSLYCDEEGKRVFVHSFCVLADVLGFTNRTLSCQSIEESQAKLDAYLDAKRDFLQTVKDRQTNGLGLRWAFAQFSDCLLMGLPIPARSRDGEGDLGSILVDISWYQASMAMDGFFLRGGMSVGELHMSPGEHHGKALVNAYMLEQKAAKTPRIVLSAGVKELVRLCQQYYSDPGQSPWASDFLVDEDGYWFVNYLTTTNYLHSTDQEMLRVIVKCR